MNFEYTVFGVGQFSEDQLGKRMNELGAEGWRLVHVMPPAAMSSQSGIPTPHAVMVFEREAAPEPVSMVDNVH